MTNNQYRNIPLQETGFAGPSQAVPPAAIVRQPGAAMPTPHEDAWMSIPVGVQNCPPGLEYLSAIDQLLIRQRVERLQLLSNWESGNRYKIKNALGQNVYSVKEDTDCWTRNSLGYWRPFDMKMFDNFQNEIIHLYRPVRCTGCLFPCCLQQMEVSSPPGTLVGSIEEEWTFWKPRLLLKNAYGEIVLKVRGPVYRMRCANDVKFKVRLGKGYRQNKIRDQTKYENVHARDIVFLWMSNSIGDEHWRFSTKAGNDEGGTMQLTSLFFIIGDQFK